MTIDILKLMEGQNFDHLSFGLMDLKTGLQSFVSCEQGIVGEKSKKYYDLASLTKPLTLAFTIHQHQELIKDKNICALIEHRAGLPIGGLLSRDTWKEQIDAYEIKVDSETSYSDYSALRAQREIEKKLNQSLYDSASKLWDREICHHRDIPDPLSCPATGFRKNGTIIGEVHDPNAFNLNNEKLSHAGLFGTAEGVLNSVYKLINETQVLDNLEKRRKEVGENQRFLLGWDTVRDQATTLAGNQASLSTFGHLGFTGTSVWIDPKAQILRVILTNATQNYWHERTGLQHLRRILGNIKDLKDPVFSIL